MFLVPWFIIPTIVLPSFLKIFFSPLFAFSVGFSTFCEFSSAHFILYWTVKRSGREKGGNESITNCDGEVGENCAGFPVVHPNHAVNFPWHVHEGDEGLNKETWASGTSSVVGWQLLFINYLLCARLCALHQGQRRKTNPLFAGSSKAL